MKKKILISIFFLAALSLAGCTSEGSPNNREANNSSWDQNEDQGDQDATSSPEEDQDQGSEEPEEKETDRTPADSNVDMDGDWRLYSKESKNVEIKYPENWYYRRALTEELDNDYYLFVEFANTPDVFEGKATSTIQLIGADPDQEIEDQEYSTLAQETEDKKFFLRTNEESLKGTVDEMATTFKFSPEDQ
ncbi:MAG TPA: hypothetical protein VKO42_03585 [Patescibacteria group bacterium]|nr:hypothetical protein [Patescibacteria group bacterium]